MQGVSLLTKTRRRPVDLFELALTYDGIEIRRPGESARHLSWDRVSEWEIEQRRDGVLLTLRGGGSVTPLVIPRWSVDELDVVLREVTAPPPDEPTPPASKADGARAAAPAPPVRPTPVVVPEAVVATESARPPAKAPTKPPTTPPAATKMAATPPPAPVVTPPVPAPVPPPIVESLVQATPSLAPAVPAVDIPIELAQALELEPEPPLEFDDVLAEQLTSRPPEVAAPAAPAAPTAADGPLVSELVWPQEPSSGSVAEGPTLSWPTATDETRGTPPTHEFLLPDAPPTAPRAMASDLSPMTAHLTFQDDLAVADLVTEDAVEALLAPATPRPAKAPPEPEPARPTPQPIFIPPREGAPDVLLPPSRAERRRTERGTRVRPEPVPKVPRVRPEPVPKVPRERPVREKAVRPPKPARAPRQPAALVRAASTVVLLAVAALAVALVLAQSAGMIHLPFLGLPG
jgi:hypothetical protein